MHYGVRTLLNFYFKYIDSKHFKHSTWSQIFSSFYILLQIIFTYYIGKPGKSAGELSLYETSPDETSLAEKSLIFESIKIR